MRAFDTDGLTSPELEGDATDIVAPIAQAVEQGDQETDAHQAELAELRSSNHRLRVENLALRTKIEGLKSSRSLERYLMIGGMMLVWLFFILFVINKAIALSS